MLPSAEDADGIAPVAAPAAWHPDPHGRATLRWWDGVQWTSMVTIDGRSFDERLADGGPTAGPGAALSRPDQFPGQPLAETDPGMQELARERYLTYHELRPGVYGGAIHITGVDGRLLAVAESDKPTTSYGFLAKEMCIYLTRTDGVHLGTLVRPKAATREDHPVIDAAGRRVGEFVGPFFLPKVAIRTEVGEVGTIHLGRPESFILDPAGQPLVRCLQTQNYHVFETYRTARQPDAFVIEKLGPVPAWLFLFALLMPIEANLRIDRSRVESRSPGGGGIGWS